MNRKVAVGAPVAVGVAVIVGAVLFHNDFAESAIAASGKAPVKIDPEEHSRWVSETGSLRAELARERERADAAEAKMKAAGVTAPARPVAPDPKDWKKCRTPEFEAKVRSIAWNRCVHTLRKWWEEMEAARREGRAPAMDRDLMGQLNEFTKEAMELGMALGLDATKAFDICSNELVGQAWMDATISDLAGSPLTEEQLGALRRTGIYTDDAAVPEQGHLAVFRRGFEHNLDLLTATRDVLTPDQYEKLSKTVGPDFMLSLYRQYQQKPIDATSAEAAAQSVAQYWTATLKLPEGSSSAVDAIAAGYARQAAALMAQSGGILSREQEAALHIDLLDLQIAAEKRLAESLPLDEEGRKRVLKGSAHAFWFNFSR